MNKTDLWLKIRAYHFDDLVPTSLLGKLGEIFGGTDAATKAFAGKLARKLGWKESFALKAISEYKKYVYLAIVSDVVVSPSKIIDQVWHEHLLFTRGYREFCDNVLGTNLDHSPELLVFDEQTSIFNSQYEDTLQLYRDEFGQEPPFDIWGKPKFKKEAVLAGGGNKYASRRKKYYADGSTSNPYSDDTALYLLITDDSGSGTVAPHRYPEFPGFDNGSFGGGGSNDNWSESHTSFNSHSMGHDVDSAPSSDSSDTGSDSGGGSDGGGGGSCSGGGCGGGD